VEPSTKVLQTIATYIDLNSVRAGLVTDPKDYRFCGYAEAIAGSTDARQGLCSALGESRSSEAAPHYRQRLFGVAAAPRADTATLSPDQFNAVIDQQGQLPLATVLRHRLRYFSDGAVLGTQAFVQR